MQFIGWPATDEFVDCMNAILGALGIGGVGTNSFGEIIVENEANSFTVNPFLLTAQTILGNDDMITMNSIPKLFTWFSISHHMRTFHSPSRKCILFCFLANGAFLIFRQMQNIVAIWFLIFWRIITRRLTFRRSATAISPFGFFRRLVFNNFFRRS